LARDRFLISVYPLGIAILLFQKSFLSVAMRMRLNRSGLLTLLGLCICLGLPAYAQNSAATEEEPIAELESQSALPPALPGGSPDLPPSLPGEPPAESTSAALPLGPNEAFSFDESAFNIPDAEDPEAAKERDRKEAYDAALQGLLPLRPDEIRALLERFDRTQESVQTPIYPNPKPEVVVQNISLDPGAKPAVIKMAYGHVTTVTFTDATGAPWPVQDISWAGNFEVMESTNSESSYTHVFRISPQSEFAYGNMSISLLSLQTPVIITLETSRELVHYRFDAVIGDYGPLAEAPLISSGISTVAGSPELSSALEGVMPKGAQRLAVSGVDGRTSAYRVRGQIFVRTPLTLLSPGWSQSVASADGTRVYQINDASVLLLSDRGTMVRARLSEREDLLNEQ
jgi:intracellular multiplication protein IcmK